ncbi:hypothetical protein BDW59DRAFT_18260 [Aspergillus cavernicola]|uniref:Uncharacterized protein n=1 Tax=Aspergillus cavernicola TaxID=176166 RepID=A0ABR4IRX7_9EURO
MVPGFAFVSVDASGKPSKGTDRKLIRSHCMRGKNRRILSWNDQQVDRHNGRDEAWTAPGQITSHLSSNLSSVNFAFELDNDSK